MNITYTSKKKISVDDYIELIGATALKELRPLDDPERIGEMLLKTDLLITAWDGDTLVGIARSVTDFAFCCYLGDLAVREDYQRKGIGKKLVTLTKDHLHNNAKVIILAETAEHGSISSMGFQKYNAAFTICDIII